LRFEADAETSPILGRSANFSADLARKQAAARQRRRRQLVKAGRERFVIEPDGDRLAAYLIRMGRISEIAAANGSDGN
jgi:uncharacterized protein (DUF58 family)